MTDHKNYNNLEVHEAMRHFRYKHLPENLQAISKPVCELAEAMALVGTGPQLIIGLQKLVEAKDCFVRSCIRND